MNASDRPAGVSRREILASTGATLGMVGTGVTDWGIFESASGQTDVSRAARLDVRDVDGPADDESYCEVATRTARELGIEAGDQIRVAVDDPLGDVDFSEKIFTVAGLIRGRSGTVWTTWEELATIGAQNHTDGTISTVVPNPSIDLVQTAEVNDEFAEMVCNEDASAESGLVLLAPHGGHIEHHTGRQAIEASDTYDLTSWACFGFSSSKQRIGSSSIGGAFDRWHVTSTEISRDSFPELDRIADVGYETALSFHGSTKSDVRVGGRADERKQRVVEALRPAYADAGIDVAVRVASREEYAGRNQNNVVNRITADGDGGIQIEQPSRIRMNHHQITARTAVEALLEY